MNNATWCFKKNIISSGRRQSQKNAITFTIQRCSLRNKNGIINAIIDMVQEYIAFIVLSTSLHYHDMSILSINWRYLSQTRIVFFLFVLLFSLILLIQTRSWFARGRNIDGECLTNSTNRSTIATVPGPFTPITGPRMARDAHSTSKATSSLRAGHLARKAAMVGIQPANSDWILPSTLPSLSCLPPISTR